MGDFTLALGGVPTALNNLKLRLLLEKRVPKGLISGVERRDNGLVILKFIRERDLLEFQNENIREIDFGDEIYPLTVEVTIQEKQVDERGPATQHNNDGDPWRRKLFVTNIPRHLDSWETLKYHFERFGRVERCFVKKRFAYVEFTNHLDALAALYGARSAGWNCYLNILWDRKERPPATQPQPLMSVPVARPRTSCSGPRRSSSIVDLRQIDRPQSAQRKKQANLQSLEQEAEDLYRNIHYWSTFQKLPADEGTMCLLVNNIEDSTSLQTVKMHFESKKRSNGGLVRSIIRMIDGLLIIFQDPKDCENCFEMKEQTLAGTSLNIFAKRIPTHFDRKFIIKGVGTGTSNNTLVMFLEQCSKHETSPTPPTKQAIPGVYLIEYGDDLDPAEVPEIMKNVGRMPLEKCLLKASLLLRTDCVKVSGVGDNSTSDAIRLKFESKKRSDGGPVTRVERLKNKAILVYFAEFTDAERVYERFKKQSEETMVIDGHEVEVELYFHSLANDHKTTVKERKPNKTKDEEDDTAASGPKPMLRSYDLQPGCKEKLFQLIRNNQTHIDKLQKLCIDFATVQISTEQKGKRPPFVKFSPVEKTSAENQKGFNSECKKRFEEFLSAFSSISPTFDKVKLEKARSANLSPLIEKNYQGDGVNIIVNWKNTAVDVIGIDESVKSFIDQINAALEFTVRKMEEIKEGQHRIMIACGIIEELQQKHPMVSIQCDDEARSITLTGSRDDLNAVQIAALELQTNIEKKKLSSVNSHILAYLLEKKDSADVRTEIEKKFKSDGAKAVLSIDDEDVYLHVRSDADYKRAVNAFIKLIKIETIKIDEATSAVVTSPMWKGFTQSLQGVDPCTVYVKPGKEIIAVGIQYHLQAFCIKINDFLDENTTRRFCLNMPYGNARFIIEKSKEFSAGACKRLGIRCRLTAEQGGGICIEGKRKALEQVRPRIVQLMQRITEFKQTLTEPGIMQYYQGEEGKEFLKMTERANNCIIMERKTNPEWERENQQRRAAVSKEPSSSYSRPKEQCFISVTLPKSTVTLQVWKANIIEHKCDVIVNASNPQLQLLLKGVSGAIKELDSRNRNKIQAEMSNHIKANYGHFLSGDAVLTTSGNLPNCKRIVHAIGPKWDSASEKEPSKALKACVFNSLQEAAKVGMTSIAIPAISCGVFGGQINVCIPLILEAVTEYFNEETRTSIRRVDFIENQMQAVLNEFTQSVKGYGGSSRESIQLTQQQTSVQPNTVPRKVRSSVKSPSVNVQLLKSDITTTQVDVIVNITSSQGFPQMDGSAISKALRQAGGSSILQECAQQPGPYNVGAVITTRGGALACQEVYHGIVSRYSQSSKQVIKGIVSQCLRTADNTGYTSIAFPAIATGGFRHPPGKVARWMNQEISNFSPTNLKNVTIVLFPNDLSTISAFQAEFSGVPRQNSGATMSAFQGSAQSKANFGAINVRVYQGDVTQETSDAIVNSTNANFDLSKGLVANAIILQGGARIQTEVQSRTDTDCRVTTGGNLPCGSIFHIVTPNNDKDIIKKVELVLREADQRGMTSISFPALATGNIGLPSSVVAHAMRKAFEKFGKSQINSLTTINVVIFNQTMLNDFKKGIFDSEQSLLGRVKDTITSLFGRGSASIEKTDEETFDLFLYSSDVNAINKALDGITRETKKMVHRHLIQDDAFGRLSNWEFWELREVETANNVKISDKSNNYLKQIAIEGLTRNVMKAHEKIKDMLKEFCEAEMAANFVTWQKLVRGNWEDYQPRSANILEKAFKVRNGNNTDPKLNQIAIVEFESNKLHHTTVDLSNLEEDHNGPNPPQIRRRINEKSSDDEVPSFWAPMQNQPFLEVPLAQGTPEYQNAYNAFINSGGSGNVIKIERIQNVSLYKQYVAKKAEVQKKLTAANSSKPVERQLFHGTSDYDKIILQGFDRSHAGKNATALGFGVYFAKNASYSNGYANPDAQGHRRMFLADVVTGDYCQGNSGVRAAPIKPSGIPNDLYDSVVDRPGNPTVFVVFKDASVYPRFLITYQ